MRIKMNWCEQMVNGLWIKVENVYFYRFKGSFEKIFIVLNESILISACICFSCVSCCRVGILIFKTILWYKSLMPMYMKFVDILSQL